MEKTYRMFYGNSFSRTPTSAIIYVAPFSISYGGSPRKVFLPTIHICYSSWSYLPCMKTLRNSGVPSAFLGESLRSVSDCVKRMSTVKTGGISLKCLIMNFMFIDAIFFVFAMQRCGARCKLDSSALLQSCFAKVHYEDACWDWYLRVSVSPLAVSLWKQLKHSQKNLMSII